MITSHAHKRIRNRLSGIVTSKDIQIMDNASKKWRNGKHYIAIRKLTGYVGIDGSYGDVLMAIVKDGCVITAMLRGSDQLMSWTDGQYHSLGTR